MFTSVHFSQWMPVQYFAHRNPEFNFYWNIEVDVRYTGHYYHLSEQLSNWARAQPRKGIWERSNHFYVPRVHGAYSTDFTQWVQKKNSPPGKPWGKHSDRSIWGPVEVLPGGSEFPLADSPPTPNPDEDSYSWGVGEDADLITLLPIFPPHETHYAFLGDYWNYPEVPPAPEPPKRCSIVTTYRFSHRLLDMMHLENSNAPGHHMGSEMWPSSVCLHHGYKAVYAPHPIWLDRKWPAKALDYIFNPGPGADAGGSESVFGLDREHNFLGSTWYYRADWARSLYWRFLGWESQGIGGKEVTFPFSSIFGLSTKRVRS